MLIPTSLMNARTIFGFLFFCGISMGTTAGQSLKPLRVDLPPVIDGLLEDDAWSGAPMVSNFVTFIPDFGKTQPERTEVLMSYDAENLYFAFRCFDDPSKIKASLSTRDNILRDDWVCINLDTFGDQQGLTAFYINPLGIQAESRFAAGKEDFSVDLVWYSAGRMTKTGYTLEVQLPLKSLRYSDVETVTMKVFFERYVSRKSEHGSYPTLDPGKGFAFLTQMTPMVYTGLRHYTLIEVLPAVVFNQQYLHNNGQFHVSDVRREASLTLKYGITSDLILDGTVNPDFSQVESDAGQVDVNLRTNLFFDERRPFFLEGRENFNIAGTESGAPLQSLFHTRQIVDPLLGVKLSGKIDANQTISTLIANDDLDGSVPGSPSQAWFGFARYKHALSEDSYAGAAFATREAGSGYNRVAGGDAQIRIGAGSLFDVHGFASLARDSGSGKTMRGHAAAARIQSADRDLQYELTVREVSTDFRADMGFLNRTGVTSFAGLIHPLFYPAGSFFQRVAVGVSSVQTLDRPSKLWETSDYLFAQVLFGGSLSLYTEGGYGTEIFLGKRFRTSSFFAQAGGQVTTWLSVTVSARSGAAIFYSSSPFQGGSTRAAASVTFHPSEQLRVDYSFVFSDFHRSSDNMQMYAYPINRLKGTYQFNKYLFVRAIGEYNGFRKRLLTDFLASFTYIPGTVLHLGYGSVYQRQEWDTGTLMYRPADKLLETDRGLFFKASYLWRL